MATSDRPRGGGVDGVDEAAKRTLRITHHWIETAVSAHQRAFEVEMERSRRTFNDELERYWKRHKTPTEPG